jgi:6-phosphogluconolactonase
LVAPLFGCGGSDHLSIGGTVTGLAGAGLVLQNNAGDYLALSADGAFAFVTKEASGAAYAVTVMTQPAAQICSVTNATGSVQHVNVTNVTVSCTTQHLYVGNDNTPGGIKSYAVPLAAASATPFFTIASNNVVAVALDASGNLAVGDNGGHLTYFTQPLSAASTPSATFNNGTPSNNGQLVFAADGRLFAPTVSNKINVFTPPFSNSTTPSSSITHASLSSAIGLAFDSSSNLYVSNASGGGSNIFVYAPPYTGAPIITPLTNGTAYRKMVISGGQVFVDSVAGGAGRVDVYILPLTTSSAPAFSITRGVNTPEGAAVDAQGNVYIGNLSDATIAVYTPPFSAASIPSTTLYIAPNPFAIFGIAIGP